LYRRSRTLSVIGLLLLALVVAAVPATARTSSHLTRHQRHQMSTRLMHAVKRHPGVIRKRWFLRQASLVNFKLPVTVQLRQGANPATTNPNEADVDLGTSLGVRQVYLGGKLPAEIQFHDSFDGGALGSVDLTLDPGGSITTTSVPLLWNSQITQPGTHWYDGAGPTSGCGDFTNANTVPSTGTANPTVGRTLNTPQAAGVGLNGLPYFSSTANANAFAASPSVGLAQGTIEEFPGADDPGLLSGSKATGNANAVGDVTPFPYSPSSTPGGFSQPPSAGDTVLRTGPLTLTVATPGTVLPGDNADGDGEQGGQTIVMGRNGGTANLFGNIPGKSYGVDVTLSVGTKINSILRVVDPDPAAAIGGQPYPGGTLACRQYWTGYVQNYLNDITLIGDLHIAPAITAAGDLRIAKVSLVADQDWDVSLAACLLPYSAYSATPGYPSGAAPNVPADRFVGQSSTGASATNPAPTVKCNQPPTPFFAATSFPSLGPLTPGLTSTADGSQVSVSASIFVNRIEADVLIGDRLP
jgi:hypothetical protein